MSEYKLILLRGFTFSFLRCATIFSRPLKAPDAMNKMFAVLTGMFSPRDERDLFSGT